MSSPFTPSQTDYIAYLNKLWNRYRTKTAPAIAAGVLTLDMEASNFFVVALNANIATMTMSNVVAAGEVDSFILIFTADGTPRTIAWMAGATWVNTGGAAPTPTSTNGKRDMYSAFSFDGGTTWFIQVVAQNF